MFQNAIFIYRVWWDVSKHFIFSTERTHKKVLKYAIFLFYDGFSFEIIFTININTPYAWGKANFKSLRSSRLFVGYKMCSPNVCYLAILASYAFSYWLWATLPRSWHLATQVSHKKHTKHVLLLKHWIKWTYLFSFKS